MFGRAPAAKADEEERFARGAAPSSGAHMAGGAARGAKKASLFEAEDDLVTLQREADLTAIHLPKASFPTAPCSLTRAPTRTHLPAFLC